MVVVGIAVGANVVAASVVAAVVLESLLLLQPEKIAAQHESREMSRISVMICLRMVVILSDM